jgi:Mrp family chromosome partitioning ATPase
MQTRPKFAGVVLNKVDFARNKYYYSRYYGHQYKNYYAEAAV